MMKNIEIENEIAETYLSTFWMYKSKWKASLDLSIFINFQFSIWREWLVGIFKFTFFFSGKDFSDFLSIQNFPPPTIKIRWIGIFQQKQNTLNFDHSTDFYRVGVSVQWWKNCSRNSSIHLYFFAKSAKSQINPALKQIINFFVLSLSCSYILFLTWNLINISGRENFHILCAECRWL